MINPKFMGAFKLVCLLSLFLLLNASAYAGTIALVPQKKKVVISVVEGEITVGGSLALHNEGTETAYVVVPVLEICGVTWKGESKGMPTGEWSDWDFTESVPESLAVSVAECAAPGAS
ncbi:MAG: hypothetical protein PHC51_13095, partial [bacterium]|nr:hypothetical protein [bacterium]